MSPRPAGRKTIGAWLERTPSGRARLCFRWKGKLHRITLEYTEKDRDELERVRNLVGSEIRAGVFDPARRFPSVFAKPARVPVVERRPTVASMMPEWIEQKRRRKVNDDRTAKYDSHLRLYVKRHAIGGYDPFDLTRADFEAFVGWIVTEGGEGGQPLSEKTASNVVRSTLKAFLRDIEADASLVALSKVRWERYVPGRVVRMAGAGEEAGVSITGSLIR